MVALPWYIGRIGLPWRRDGCLVELLAAYEAAGVPLQDGEVPGSHLDHEALTRPDKAPWECLGLTPAAATKALDVVVTRTASGGGFADRRLHLYTMVDADSGQFITSDRQHGTRCYSRRAIPPGQVVGVYRLKRLGGRR